MAAGGTTPYSATTPAGMKTPTGMAPPSAGGGTPTSAAAPAGINTPTGGATPKGGAEPPTNWNVVLGPLPKEIFDFLEVGLAPPQLPRYLCLTGSVQIRLFQFCSC